MICRRIHLASATYVSAIHASAIHFGAIFVLMLGTASPGAQSAQDTKETSKSEPKVESKKSEGPAKSDDTKTKPGIDQLKLPAGSVLVVVDEIQKAMKLVPNSILLTPAKYQELMERIAELERRLHLQKKGVYFCKLTGKLEGNYVRFQTEFTFTTEKPGMTVVLGLKGAHLLDEGELDSALPALDYGPDGYTIQVAGAGTHRLRLAFKVAVGQRRPMGTSSSERGFDLSLPGAAVTSLLLDLPAGIKEIRWNDKLENKRVGGRWELALGNAKSVTVVWKEPVTLPGSGPLLTSEGDITVRLEENAVLLQADLGLEDSRGQTREWKLLLPKQARVEVKVASSLLYDVFPPEGKNPYYIVRFAEPNAERFKMRVQMQYPRPTGAFRLPVGPFLVEDAYSQLGTIQVLGKTSSTRGQRLVFHTQGETFQRDLPKEQPGAELIARFQYWDLNGAGKKNKDGVPLLIEWKTEKGQVETAVEHTVKLHSGLDGMHVVTESRIKVKSLYTGLDALNVQLPRRRPRGLELFAWQPGAGFPATVPWLALERQLLRPHSFAILTDVFVEEDSASSYPELSASDADGKAEIKLRSPQAREFTLVLSGRYLVPKGQRRLRIELPRPLGTLDRGAKLTLQTDEQFELLVGPWEREEPVPQKHTFQTTFDQSPSVVDLAWRDYRPEFPVAGLIDIQLRGKQAHVRTELEFSVPKSLRREGLAPGHVRLQVTPGQMFKIVSGGRLIDPEPDKGWALVELAADFPARGPLIIEYDCFMPASAGSHAGKGTDGSSPVPNETRKVDGPGPSGTAAPGIDDPGGNHKAGVPKPGVPRQGGPKQDAPTNGEAKDGTRADGLPGTRTTSDPGTGNDGKGNGETARPTTKIEGTESPSKEAPAATVNPWKVPLIWPENATLLDAKVRVWCEPGQQPRVVNAVPTWFDRGTEVVPGMSTLPALVLTGTGRTLDLTLELGQEDAANTTVLVGDRGLIQVAVDEAGNQHCRARYLIRKLNSNSVDIELPPAANIQSIHVNKRRIHWTSHDTEWNVVRLNIDPELFQSSVLLDIEYKLASPGDQGKQSWQNEIYPPKFRGKVFLGQVRWQIHLPGGWVSIALGGDIQPEYTWAFRNYLLTPLPAFTSDEAEQWLLGESAEGDFRVNLAFARASQEPVWLVHLPRQTWLLLCSGIVLVVGLVFYFVTLSRPFFWFVIGVLALGLVGAGFFWPNWVPPLVLGTQPGLVVLAIIMAIHWLLLERYRRQVIFMPGFTRMQPGSSLSTSVPREPSTVDAPPPGSSHGTGHGSSVNKPASY